MRYVHELVCQRKYWPSARAGGDADGIEARSLAQVLVQFWVREHEEESMRKVQRVFRYGTVAAAMTLTPALATPAWAETGAVSFEIAKAGFIVGVGGGSGMLVFKRHRYPLSVGGLSVGATIGASKANLVGRALNLRQASDIAGTYTAVGGGVAVGGGASGIRLQNARGVVLELSGRNIGLEFNANVSGVQISLR